MKRLLFCPGAALLTLTVACGFAGTALAQDPTQQGAVPVVEHEESGAIAQEQGRGIEYGGHVVVPIFLGATEEFTISPGLGFQGRIGWEFPEGLSTELNLGIMYNPTDFQTGLDTKYAFFNFWVGAGGRFSILNPSALVPFVGLGVALNLWQNATTFSKSGMTVSEKDKSVITVGGYALVGVAFELNPWVAIEAGAQINVTPSPDRADLPAQPELWLTPFLGGTLYY